MKIIGVSQRVDHFDTIGEWRDTLDQRLVNFVAACGALAVPVPNTLINENNLTLWLRCIKPDAFILSGGNDLGSSLDRDNTEQNLLKFAFTAEKPVLGICRGMQMMAVFSGGTLKSVRNHVGTRHSLNGEIHQRVNSYHNFSLAEKPSKFSTIAYSEDGEIEAIRHERLKWEGWMWHPEREQSFNSEDVSRLINLIK